MLESYDIFKSYSSHTRCQIMQVIPPGVPGDLPVVYTLTLTLPPGVPGDLPVVYLSRGLAGEKRREEAGEVDLIQVHPVVRQARRDVAYGVVGAGWHDEHIPRLQRMAPHPRVGEQRKLLQIRT